MDDDDARAYAAKLEYTLKELQNKVAEHEKKLNELRAEHHAPLTTPTSQIQTIARAFDDATNSDPFLPFPGSVLPALLALRKTHQTMTDSRAFLASQAEAAEREKRRLDADRTALRDHKLIEQALAARIASLTTASEEGPPEDQGGDEAARRRIEGLAEKKRHYGRETSRLMKALNGFINDHLAIMLAAEELGGPVVGDMLDVQPEDLAGGFSAQGRPKKKPKTKDDEDGGKKQRRIDEFWGGGGGSDEVVAAAEGMRQLTEDLLNKLMEEGGGAYVQLPRESAAARFLIRCKVAEFHPKDATRIRLLDFGRELEE